MLFWVWKKNMIKLLKIYQLRVRIGWGLTGSKWKSRWSFKQQLDIKWSLFTLLFPILLRNKQKPIRIVVKATYNLHSNKYFEIWNVTFWGRSLVTKLSRFHLISRAADEIKALPISTDFRNGNKELLLLFSIRSVWFYWSLLIWQHKFRTRLLHYS